MILYYLAGVVKDSLQGSGSVFARGTITRMQACLKIATTFGTTKAQVADQFGWQDVYHGRQPNVPGMQ